MIPLRDNANHRYTPIVTWTLIALNIIIYIWDRQGHVFGGSVVFADLSMRPREVIDAVKGVGDRFPVVTIFTAMFLHGSILHIAGNMVFLSVFGTGIELALGPFRYALYYIFWGMVATATQIYVGPHSSVPVLGASGAIGGVLGAYFLLFPSNKIEIIFPIFAFYTLVVSAWVMLGLWFLWQILIPQQGVANWAHAGGFLAGMITVLIMGGRTKVLKGREAELDQDLF